MHLIQVLLSDDEDDSSGGGGGVEQAGGANGVQRASSITDCASIIDNTISSLSYDEYSDYESLSIQQQYQQQQQQQQLQQQITQSSDVDDSGYQQIEEKGTFYCSNHFGKTLSELWKKRSGSDSHKVQNCSMK